MDDIPTMHPMEDFFVNPIVFDTNTCDQQEEREWRRSIVKKRSTMNFQQTQDSPLALEHTAKGPVEDAKFVDLANKVFFRQSYASDEEAPSPADDNEKSSNFGSSESEGEEDGQSRDIMSDRQSLSDDMEDQMEDVDQQCNEAHAMTVVAVGKPRMISVPKLVDIPRRKRPASTALVGPSRLRDQLEQVAVVEDEPTVSSPLSSRDSSDKSTRSTPPSSFEEEHSKRATYARRPSIPLMEAVADSPRAGSFGSSKGQASSPSYFDERPESRRRSPGGRLLQRFPSSLSLTLRSPLSSPRSPPVLSPKLVDIPERSVSLKSRLVARGAAERAPPLVLPPCPEGDEPSKRRSSTQPKRTSMQHIVHMRKDSVVTPPGSPTPGTRKLQRKPRMGVLLK